MVHPEYVLTQAQRSQINWFLSTLTANTTDATLSLPRAGNSAVQYRVHFINGHADFVIKNTVKAKISRYFSCWYFDTQAELIKGHINRNRNLTKAKEYVREQGSIHSCDVSQYEFDLSTPIDTSPRLPQTSSEWLAAIHLPVSENNPQLKILADLDESVLHYGKPCGRMRIKFDCRLYLSGVKYALYYDPVALDDLARAQQRGHKVVVITNAKYPYKVIQCLFATRGIGLKENDYFNINHPSRRNKSDKKSFIESLPFGRESTLIDDLPENTPNNTHFIQVFPECMYPIFTDTDSLPSTVEQWNELSKQFVSDSRIRLTLFVSTKALFDSLDSQCGNAVTLKPALVQLMRRVQIKDHRIVILHSEELPFLSVTLFKRALESQGITLESSDCFTLEQIRSFRCRNNARLLDFLGFEKDCLLLDSSKRKKTKVVHFVNVGKQSERRRLGIL
ncbi:MAG: hypothetical protein ACPGUD_11720 [Parashewanella sp.]